MYVGDHIYADTQLGRLEDDIMMTTKLLHLNKPVWLKNIIGLEEHRMNKSGCMG